MSKICQGDIYFVNFDYMDIVGSEQKGSRPCVVISSCLANEYSSLLIVCPITSREKKNIPTHYALSNETYPFLKCKNNIVLTENVMSISKMRLNRYLGRISEQDIVNIITKLGCNFGLYQ